MAREPTSVALERVAKMLDEAPLGACPDHDGCEKEGCEGEGSEGGVCGGEASRGCGVRAARRSKFGGRLRSAQQFADGSSTIAAPPSSPGGGHLVASQSAPAMSLTT